MDGIFTRRNIAILAAVLTSIVHVLTGLEHTLLPDTPAPCAVVTSTPVLLTPDQP
jgi:hypothetical protein